ncbi:YIP1 family protein [Actibacterium pelagium]|uniref:YIP1 family protein n=1 Tax=Actibacterium pelagium TaxID=2029103 RepID=A0A917ABV6_9RHOB|nr:YIP1 family protein [Actibacterium pelagium]GGE41336.1 YIP1 family protein [Actibacterium pelagium]
MTTILQNLWSLALESVQTPRVAARKVLELPATRGQAWGAFVAMILLSVVLTGIGQILFPVPPEQVLAFLQMSPFQAVGLLGGITLALIMAIVSIGRLMGGQGDMDGGLRLFAWMQAILIALQVVQLLLVPVMAILAALLGLVSIALFIWLLLNFVAELHKFDGIGQAIVVTVLSFVLTTFVLISLISQLGLLPVMEAPNV